jgi:hypothetical protein
MQYDLISIFDLHLLRTNSYLNQSTLAEFCKVHLSTGREQMTTRYAVAVVKGAKPEEAFVIVGNDFEKGEPKYMSKPMSEEEMRKHRAADGLSDAEIEEEIQRARRDPK